MGVRGRTPKPNARRVAPMAFRRNQEIVAPVGCDQELVDFVLRQIDNLWPTARRWARAALTSPQSRVFTDAEVALVEVGAHILHRWRHEGADRRSSELNEWGRINDRLLGTHAARLRAHVELVAAAPVEAPDELAEARRVRDRLSGT